MLLPVDELWINVSRVNSSRHGFLERGLRCCLSFLCVLKNSGGEGRTSSASASRLWLAAMETAVLSAVLRTLGPKLYAFLRDGHDLLRRDLERDVHYIRNELAMIAAAIEEHDRRPPLPPHAAGDVRSAWIRGVRDLACDMEDCVDRFAHRATGHGLASMGARAKFAAVIQELRRKSEELSRLRASYAAAGEPSCSVATGSSALTLPASSSEAHTLASDIVGMDGPRDEILELIGETQGQLKVISIVGFGGLGKTLLARQIYESDAVAAQFHPRIWVRAAGKNAEDVLMEILQQLWMPVHHCDASNLVVNLRNCLESKR